MKNQLPDKIAAGETRVGVQICPFGEFPNGGRAQHCTRAALNEVVADWEARGRKEVLCDFEHQSEAGGTSDTTAAAWISNLRVDPARGLVGDFKFTDVGAEAVTNRRLRFLSVVWLVDKATRAPLRITSVALTNKPNIPVESVLNRAPQPSIEHVEEKEENMDEIKKALDLPPETSDADVLAAIAEMKSTRDELAARVQGLEEAAEAAKRAETEKEAEAFAEANKETFDKATLKAQYIANREATRALVGALRPPAPAAAPAQIVLNRARTPDLSRANLVAELNKLHGQAKINFAVAHASEFHEAVE